MTQPAPAPAPWTAARRPRRVWDLVLTVGLLVALTFVSLLASGLGGLLAMASDPCGGSLQCNDGLLTAGVLLGIGGPWAILLLAVGASVVLLVVRRLAFWVPIAAAILLVVNFFVAAAVATAGVPQ